MAPSAVHKVGAGGAACDPGLSSASPGLSPGAQVRGALTLGALPANKVGAGVGRQKQCLCSPSNAFSRVALNTTRAGDIHEAPKSKADVKEG